MEEIAEQFREELQELLDRYKTKLSVPRIMGVAQDVFHKTLSFKYHPEYFKGLGYAWQCVDQVPQCIFDAQDYTFKCHCSAQEIAEAGCDGDIRHCKNACGKLRMNKTTISDYQGADRCHKD